MTDYVKYFSNGLLAFHEKIKELMKSALPTDLDFIVNVSDYGYGLIKYIKSVPCLLEVFHKRIETFLKNMSCSEIQAITQAITEWETSWEFSKLTTQWQLRSLERYMGDIYGKYRNYRHPIDFYPNMLCIDSTILCKGAVDGN